MDPGASGFFTPLVPIPFSLFFVRRDFLFFFQPENPFKIIISHKTVSTHPIGFSPALLLFGFCERGVGVVHQKGPRPVKLFGTNKPLRIMEFALGIWFNDAAYQISFARSNVSSICSIRFNLEKNRIEVSEILFFKKDE